MRKKNYSKLEKEVARKAEQRERKKKKMPVSGKSVFELQRLMRKGKRRRNL